MDIKIVKFYFQIKFNFKNEEPEDYEEQTPTTFNSSTIEGRISLFCLIDIIRDYLDKYEYEHINYEKDEISHLKESHKKKNAFYTTILFCLIYLDGLIMINIDNAKKINYISEMHKSEILKVLCLLIQCKKIEDNLKEIASHIICAILGFCELESSKEEYFSFIIRWTREYHVLSYEFFLILIYFQKKR